MPAMDSGLAKSFDFPEGDHAVLLIHGFTGSPAHMRLVGDGLREKGFAVRGVCLPGHGTVPEDMLKTGWQDWLLCVRTAVKELRERYAYVTAAGLSMGGVLALMLAEENDLTACVPIATPMGTVNRFRFLSPLIAPFVPMLKKRVDPVRATLHAQYDVGYEVTPTAKVRDLSVLMRRCRQQLHLVHCPVLVIQSHGDRVVTPDSPGIILDGVRSEKKGQLWLDRAPHVCTISDEYPRIVDAMASFLRGCEGK